MDILSPARFLPMPLRHRYIAELQPANQTPVWDRLDLDHLGIHVADTSIVAKLHNMAYAGAKLNDFSATNIGMNETDKDLTYKPVYGGGMKSSRSTKHITSIPEAVGALLNCFQLNLIVLSTETYLPFIFCIFKRKNFEVQV